MGWIKTIWYILLATAILAVVVGLGLAVVAAVFVGGLVISAIGAVIYVAMQLQEHFSSSSKIR